VKEQLDAWPFRQVKARSLSGWMIQAIENKYDLPEAYLARQKEQTAGLTRDAVASQRKQCQLCDRNGFRNVRSANYPRGAMRQCTHIAEIETQYQTFEISEQKNRTSPNAQNSSLRGDTNPTEESPAGDSVSL
jgi:arginyl-tRNA--protein-N-Asp/Glu arginylyltransferase